MSNFLQMASNLDAIDSGWTASEGSAIPNPIANLYTYYELQKWISLTSTANQYLQLDTVNDARARSGLAVAGHNFTLLGASLIRLQGSDSATFASGNVTAIDNLTLNTGAILSPFDGGLSYTKRYWRLYFLGTLSAAPSVGVIYVDDLLDFGYPYDFPYRSGNRSHQTLEREMLNGLVRTYQTRIGRRTWKVSFKGAQGGLSDTVRTKWQALYERSRGKLRPVFIRDVDGASSYYVHLDMDDDEIEGFRYNTNGLNELRYKEAYAK